MSAFGHKGTSTEFDHLVGGDSQTWRNSYAKCSGVFRLMNISNFDDC